MLHTQDEIDHIWTIIEIMREYEQQELDLMRNRCPEMFDSEPPNDQEVIAT